MKKLVLIAAVLCCLMMCASVAAGESTPLAPGVETKVTDEAQTFSFTAPRDGIYYVTISGYDNYLSPSIDVVGENVISMHQISDSNPNVTKRYYRLSGTKAYVVSFSSFQLSFLTDDLTIKCDYTEANDDGWIYGLRKTGSASIVAYEGDDTELSVPSTLDGHDVYDIGYYAFKGSGLKSVVIEKGISFIGTGSFENCASLSKVTIPDDVTHIYRNAFKNCPSLSGITIPPSVNDIDDGAFDGCAAGFTITGMTNSYADIYAQSNNINFVSNGVIPILRPKLDQTLAVTDESSKILFTPDESGLYCFRFDKLNKYTSLMAENSAGDCYVIYRYSELTPDNHYGIYIFRLSANMEYTVYFDYGENFLNESSTLTLTKVPLTQTGLGDWLTMTITAR